MSRADDLSYAGAIKVERRRGWLRRRDLPPNFVDVVAAADTKIGQMPEDYLPTLLNNGNPELPPSDYWSYAPSASGGHPREIVTGIPELADLGISVAYRIDTAIGRQSQIVLNAARTAALGLIPGQTLLLCSIVYSSTGADWPATTYNNGSWLGHGPTLGGAAYVYSTNGGFVQISAKVRMYYATIAVPASPGAWQQFALGFTVNVFPLSAATRYHTGFYLHQAEAPALPTSYTFRRYTGYSHPAPLKVRQMALDQIATRGGTGASGLIVGSDYTGYVECMRGSDRWRRHFTVGRPASRTQPMVFDLRATYCGGVCVHNSTDDATPYRYDTMIVGANHGFICGRSTAMAHGKTAADIGSVWSTGGIEYVLIDIISADTLFIARRTSNASPPTGANTYTHVSGAASTASIATTATEQANQFYPPHANYRVQGFVDGQRVALANVTTTYQDNVSFVESYDLMLRQDVIDWYIATKGVGVQPSGNAAFNVSNTYRFDVEGGCTQFQHVVALRAGVSVQDLMFMQSIRLFNQDGVIRHCIPKALPFTQSSVSYNYAAIDTGDTLGIQLDFTPARAVATGQLIDRGLMISDNFGQAIGFLPEQSAAPAERRTLATVKALRLESNNKWYFSLVDKGSFNTAVGDSWSAVGFRNFFRRDPARTCFNVVRTGKAIHLQADWHRAGIDRIPMPADVIGRDMVVVEKSDNVAIIGNAATFRGVLLVSVADSSPAYLVLRAL